MMEIYSIKEKLPEAAKVYMDSWKESHKDICSAEFIEKHNEEYMENFLRQKLDDGYDIFIGFEGERPVGIVGINPKDEEICLLYVSPKEQGKGFGGKLLDFALDFYTKRGFVPDENQPEQTKEKRIFERKYVYQNKNMC